MVKCGEQMGVRNYPAPSWDKVNPIFPAIANEQRPLPVPYMHAYTTVWKMNICSKKGSREAAQMQSRGGVP